MTHTGVKRAHWGRGYAKHGGDGARLQWRHGLQRRGGLGETRGRRRSSPGARRARQRARWSIGGGESGVDEATTGGEENEEGGVHGATQLDSSCVMMRTTTTRWTDTVARVMVVSGRAWA